MQGNPSEYVTRKFPYKFKNKWAETVCSHVSNTIKKIFLLPLQFHSLAFCLYFSDHVVNKIIFRKAVATIKKIIDDIETKEKDCTSSNYDYIQ